MPVTVLLVDDGTVVRMGLRILIELEPDVQIIGETSTVTEGLRLAERNRPHIVILGLRDSGASAAATARQFLASDPACLLIALAPFGDSATRAEILEAGAVAFVEKNRPQDLITAFRQVRDNPNLRV